MDLDNIQRKYGLPAPLPVVQNGKFATRFPLNLEHRGDDVFQFGGKYIGEIENIYDLLYKILTNQEIDASLALPYAIKITEDKLYVRDKTNSEWILIFDITKPNFPKEIELYELIYKAITHQVIGEDTSYPGQFKIEENILYVRDKDNLTWTQIGDVTKEFLGATEATQAILEQINEILIEVQELKTELNRQITTTNETLTTALKAANEAMTSAQSINIRTFNSVEEMKASNTLKAGALAKTLGFYTAGDGGGANYLVDDTIAEDEADGASIITLQNSLYAKLLVQDYVNVKQMGAKGNVVLNKDWTIDNIDEATDDTVYINKAIEFAYNKGINVILPYKAYKISGKIVLYPSVTILPVGDCFFAFTGENSNICLELEETQVRHSSQDMASMYIDNSMGKLFIENVKEVKTDTVGLKLNASDGLSIHPHFKGLILSNFETSVFDYGHNIYFLQFSDCVLRACTVAYRFGEELYSTKNSGERTCFTNCVITGCNCAFYTFSNAEISIINSSVNYNSVLMYLNYNGTFNFIACHLEGNGFVGNNVGAGGITSDKFENYTGIYYYGFSDSELRIMPNINFTDCTYVTDKRVTATSVTGKGLFNLVNFSYSLNEYFSSEWLIDKKIGAMDCLFCASKATVNIVNPKSITGVGATIIPANKNVLKNDGWFGTSDIQTITQGSTTLEDYILTAPSDGSVSIKNNEWGARSLFINAQNTFFLKLVSRLKYPVKHSKIGSMMFIKVPDTITDFNNFVCTIWANFYNSAGEKIGDKVQIGSSRQSLEASFYQENKGVLLACEGDYGMLHNVIIPQEAFSFDLEIQAQLYSNQNQIGEYQVGGFRVYTWD